MNREDLEARILYSHYLERLYSTACGRIDKIISVLIIISGSSIILKANPVIFGVFIVVLTVVQTEFQFGKKSGSARKKSFDYQRLYTNESRYTDEDLNHHLLELESSDDPIWASLEEVAVIKTEIKLGTSDAAALTRLPLKTKLIRFLCG